MTRIEEQAHYYKNLLLRDRSIKAVVHLENAEDERFWNNQLQNASPAKYFFRHTPKTTMERIREVASNVYVTDHI